MKMKLLTLTLFSLGLASASALAQDDPRTPLDEPQATQDQTRDTTDRDEAFADRADEMGPMEDLREAASIVDQMREDQELTDQIAQAEGLFIVPDYAAAALIAGVSGGEGILVTRQEDGWSNPAFYNIGSASLGAQAGVSAGAIAMLLMTQEAVDAFREESSFSLTAQAGLSIINWSARTQTQIGEDNDIVVWTDTEGLLAEASVGLEGILFDEDDNEEYYGEMVTPEQAVAGNLESGNENVLARRLES
ncbi:MAG: lipid-binding SYLF domain-containing protein [Pseudohongiellaceae bacterium]